MEEVPSAADTRAGEVRSDVAMVLREIDAGGTVRLWDVGFPANLARAACAIADVSLTRQQWAGYAGTQPFQQVCPAG